MYICVALCIILMLPIKTLRAGEMACVVGPLAILFSKCYIDLCCDFHGNVRALSLLLRHLKVYWPLLLWIHNSILVDENLRLKYFPGVLVMGPAERCLGQFALIGQSIHRKQRPTELGGFVFESDAFRQCSVLQKLDKAQFNWGCACEATCATDLYSNSQTLKVSTFSP